MAGDDQTHGGGKRGEIVAWESEVCGEDVTDLTVRAFKEASGLTVSKRYATLRQVSVVPGAWNGETPHRCFHLLQKGGKQALYEAETTNALVAFLFLLTVEDYLMHPTYTTGETGGISL